MNSGSIRSGIPTSGCASWRTWVSSPRSCSRMGCRSRFARLEDVGSRGTPSAIARRGWPTTVGWPTSVPRCRAARRPGGRLLRRRHRPRGRGCLLGEGARPRRDHDAGAEPGRHLLLRSCARPGVGGVPGHGPPDQSARRHRCAGVQPTGLRVDPHVGDGALVLLGPVVVADHGRWCLRPLPGSAAGVRGDRGVLDAAGDQPAPAVHGYGERLDGLCPLDES